MFDLFRFALRDLFPTRRWHPLSLSAWMTGLLLVSMVSLAISIGLTFEAGLEGARGALEDPEQLKVIAVDAVTLGDSTYLNAEKIDKVKRLPFVSDVKPYTTIDTVYPIAAAGPGDLERVVPNSALRTIRFDDPALAKLRWLVGPGRTRSGPRQPFASKTDLAVIVTKDLLERLGLADLVSRLRKFFEDEESVLKNKALTDQDKDERLAKIDGARRAACQMTFKMQSERKAGAGFEGFSVPVNGVVEHVPGSGSPSIIVVESFEADYRDQKHPLSPNPRVRRVELRDLSRNEVDTLRTSWLPTKAGRYKLEWSPDDGGGAVDALSMQRRKSHDPEQRYDLLLKPVPRDLRYEEAKADLATTNLGARAMIEPPPRGLTGRVPAVYKYTDVYLSDLDQYLAVHRSLRALGLGTDSAQYESVSAIRHSLEFFRWISRVLLSVANVAMGLFLIGVLMISTHARIREIAALRANGAGWLMVLGIYGAKGLIITMVGAAVGAVLTVPVWCLLVEPALQEALEKALPPGALVVALGAAWYYGAFSLVFVLAGAFTASAFALGRSNPEAALKA
jgi:hypothetical protein